MNQTLIFLLLANVFYFASVAYGVELPTTEPGSPNCTLTMNGGNDCYLDEHWLTLVSKNRYITPVDPNDCCAGWRSATVQSWANCVAHDEQFECGYYCEESGDSPAPSFSCAVCRSWWISGDPSGKILEGHYKGGPASYAGRGEGHGFNLTDFGKEFPSGGITVSVVECLANNWSEKVILREAVEIKVVGSCKYPDGAGFNVSPYVIPGIPESCCRKLPRIELGNLMFQAASGELASCGSSVQIDIRSLDGGELSDSLTNIQLPGKVAMTKDQIENSNIHTGPGAWMMTDLTYGQTFSVTVTDDKYRYVFEQEAEDGQLENIDWDGYQIPLTRVYDRTSGGVLIREFSTERVPGMPRKYRITEQLDPSNQDHELVYFYENPAAPDMLTSVQSRVGGSEDQAIHLEYDEHDRLTKYRLGLGICSGCIASGQELVYVDYDADRDDTYNHLVAQRKDLDGKVLGLYEYDSRERLTRLARGSADPNSPDYQLVKEVQYSFDVVNDSEVSTVETKRYIDDANYELKRTIETATKYDDPLRIVVETENLEWSGLNGSGDGPHSTVTTYTRYRAGSHDTNPRITQFPRGNKLVEMRYKDDNRILGYKKNKVKDRYRTGFSGANPKMTENFTYWDEMGQTNLWKKTNMFGGVTSNWYHDICVVPPQDYTDGYQPYFGTLLLPQILWPSFQENDGLFITDTNDYYDRTGVLVATINEVPDEPNSIPGSTNMPLVTRYYYDYGKGRITRQSRTVGNDSVMTEYQYDGYGRRTKRIDDLGGENLITEFDYNTNNQLYRIKDPRGVVRRTCYGMSGERVQEYTVAALSPTDESLALEETLYKYDNNGLLQLVFVRDVEGEFSVASVDGYNGYPDPPAGFDNYAGSGWFVTEYQYDEYGRRTKQIIDPGEADGRKLTTSYEYDYQDRVVKTITPMGTYTRTIRDGRGMEVKQIIGYMDGETEVPVSVTCFGYDPNGNMTQMTDPSGVVTTYEYDEYDRKTKMTFAGGTPCDAN